jgi:hypothetical protein
MLRVFALQRVLATDWRLLRGRMPAVALGAPGAFGALGALGPGLRLRPQVRQMRGGSAASPQA